MHGASWQAPVLQAYNGQVRQDAAAEQLLPAAWRLEKYLDAEDDDSYSLGSLRCGCGLILGCFDW